MELPEQMSADLSGPREARAFVRSALHRCPDRVATAELLVSELVTNAIVHGASPVLLEVVVGDKRLRVTVRDANRRLPVLEHVDDTAEHGRGIAIVEHLATRWGVDAIDGNGKAVWFELDLAG